MPKKKSGKPKKASAPRRARFETSSERVATIHASLVAFANVPGICDKFDSTDSLRDLAADLRVPYLEVLATDLGMAELTVADIDEYNEWRAAIGRGQG